MEAAGSLTAYAVAFLADWAILRVALIPILGRLVWVAAVVFGLGALAVVIWWGLSVAGVAPAAASATDPRIVAAVRGCG